ncbi:MAG: methyltransferase domain-containing protein [Polyangiales bacterium]|nr:methyltransferase domain-containing protein [Myxococcales bacterium]
MRSPLEGPVQTRPCPLCGGARSTPFRTRSDGGQFVECNACGMLHLNPAPTPEALGTFYANYWGVYRKPQRPTRASVANAVARGHRDLIEEFLLQTVHRVPERIADVGCGSGGRLARLRARGAKQVAGCEPDAEAAAYAASELGLNVVAGDADGITLPTGGFDVVILSEVIEHVLDPVKLLSQCARLLGPTGVLILSTPNAGVRHRADTEWRGLDTDFDHLAVFDDRSIRHAFEAVGLRAREVLTWGLPSDSAEMHRGGATSRASRMFQRAERVAQKVLERRHTKPQLLVPNEGYRLLCSATWAPKGTA